MIFSKGVSQTRIEDEGMLEDFKLTGIYFFYLHIPLHHPFGNVRRHHVRPPCVVRIHRFHQYTDTARNISGLFSDFPAACWRCSSEIALSYFLCNPMHRSDEVSKRVRLQRLYRTQPQTTQYARRMPYACFDIVFATLATVCRPYFMSCFQVCAWNVEQRAWKHELRRSLHLFANTGWTWFFNWRDQYAICIELYRCRKSELLYFCLWRERVRTLDHRAMIEHGTCTLEKAFCAVASATSISARFCFAAA